MQIPRQPRLLIPRPVDDPAVQQPAKLSHKAIPCPFGLIRLPPPTLACQLRRLPQPDDSRHIFGAAAQASLLAAAQNYRFNIHAVPHIQRPHALGPIYLMAGYGQHINPQRRHIHRNFAHRLHRVGMQQHPTAGQHFSNLGHRHDGAHLIVGVHNTYQQGIRAQRLGHLPHRYPALPIRRQISHGKALLLQAAAAIQHRGVLNGRGNNVPPLKALGHPHNRQIIRLGPPTGKIYLLGTGIHQRTHLFPRLVHRRIGVTPKAVDTAGVAPIIPHTGRHRRPHLGIRPGGCAVVQVNPHDAPPCFIAQNQPLLQVMRRRQGWLK